jgi:hypothetical protein
MNEKHDCPCQGETVLIPLLNKPASHPARFSGKKILEFREPIESEKIFGDHS